MKTTSLVPNTPKTNITKTNKNNDGEEGLLVSSVTSQFLLNNTKNILLFSCYKRTGSTGYIGGDAFYALHEAHPDWEFSLLVRSEDKGRPILSAYPRVKLAIGSLDDSDVIEDAARKADIVVRMFAS